MPQHLFVLNCITATRFISVFPKMNLGVSSTPRMLSVVSWQIPNVMTTSLTTFQPLHWLKIQERITYAYKRVSVTCDVIAISQPARSTRSSKLITLYCPEVTSKRTIVNRSAGRSTEKHLANYLLIFRYSSSIL